MDWNYINGFFDADGSITAVKVHKNGNRTIQLSFHNNELDIINAIRSFIEKEIGHIGSLSKKKAKKETHSDSYDLKYNYQQGYDISLHLTSLHPKKKHRIEVYKCIQEATIRNGKYTIEQQNRRDQLIEKFFNFNPSDSTTFN